MSDWQPAETAPKGFYETKWLGRDGYRVFHPENILILTKDKEIYVAHWSNSDPSDVWLVARGAEGYQNWEFYFEEKEVTHWMHLPKLPEEKKSE